MSDEIIALTIDSQIFTMKGRGAGTCFNITTPEFAAVAIRKAAEIGWTPTHDQVSVSQSIAGLPKPAGFDNARDLLSVTGLRDALDPRWKAGKEVADYIAFMKKPHPAGHLADQLNVNGYSLAQTMVGTLKRAGDNPTRENILKQAASPDIVLPMVYPGVPLKTAADDIYPLERLQAVRFNGSRHDPLGPVLGRRVQSVLNCRQFLPLNWA